MPSLPSRRHAVPDGVDDLPGQILLYLPSLVRQFIHGFFPGMTTGPANVYVLEAVRPIGHPATGTNAGHEVGIHVARRFTPSTHLGERASGECERPAGGRHIERLGGCPAAVYRAVEVGQVDEARSLRHEVGPARMPGEDEIGDVVGAVVIVIVDLCDQLAVGDAAELPGHVGWEDQTL